VSAALQSYGPAVAEYFRRPVRNLGADIGGRAGSLEQGALICIGADVNEGKLQQVGFRAFACPHIIAACNWLVEQLENRPVAALQDIDTDILKAKFDIPVEKAGKLLILQDALKTCYLDFQGFSASGK
jgi:NifU-like protein involved in Fe-S cluster formation